MVARNSGRRLILGAGILILGMLALSHLVALSQSPSRAGLVVVHGDGRTVTRCVEFTGEPISGYELLARSGLDLGIEASAIGAAICRLDGEGCTFPQNACFCQCFGSPCYYWSYWRMTDGGWQYSSIGASNTTVRGGQVEGWSWSTGVIGSAADSLPPALSYAQICEPELVATQTAAAVQTGAALQPTATATSPATPVPATATAIATPTPTAPWTPSATPSATWASPASTSTPVPTATPTPTETPTITATPQPVPAIVRFDAERGALTFGEPLVLNWEVVGALSVVLRLPDGELPVEARGSWTGTPNRSAVITLIARGIGGDAMATVEVDVAPVFSAPTAAVTAPQPATPLAATPIPTLTATPEPSPTAAPPPVQTNAPAALVAEMTSPLTVAGAQAATPANVGAAGAATQPVVLIVVTPTAVGAPASPTLPPVALAKADTGAAALPAQQQGAPVAGQPVLLALVILAGLAVVGGGVALFAVLFLWVNRQP